MYITWRPNLKMSQYYIEGIFTKFLIPIICTSRGHSAAKPLKRHRLIVLVGLWWVDSHKLERFPLIQIYPLSPVAVPKISKTIFCCRRPSVVFTICWIRVCIIGPIIRRMGSGISIASDAIAAPRPAKLSDIRRKPFNRPLRYHKHIRVVLRCSGFQSPFLLSTLPSFLRLAMIVWLG